ncbi:hypothetical protein RRG08_009983 [Elysia crispata]|uniref:Uncharacterized protein n=1 Tax=Elysia crispata TaxID=231223 RepID=A0AAE1EAF3_9GAST|nr:hypothetical protein RRG08_009983 [Elysia crispata]
MCSWGYVILALGVDRSQVECLDQLSKSGLCGVSSQAQQQLVQLLVQGGGVTSKYVPGEIRDPSAETVSCVGGAGSDWAVK